MIPERGDRKYSSTPAGLPLSAFVLLCQLLALCGWAFFLLGAIRGHLREAGQLFPPDYPLTDFYLYKPTFALYHTEAFNHDIPGHARFAYPPVLAPVYELFYALPHRTTLFLLCAVAVWAVLIVAAMRILWPRLRSARQHVAFGGCLVLCYPAAFLLDRGNFEIFVWAATLTGILCYRTGRYNACGLAFGAAAACKLYPILLFGLLLRRRSIRPFLLGLMMAACVTVVALWWSGPTFAQAARGFAGGIGGFQQTYAGKLRSGEVIYDHSLFSVVKTLAVYAGKNFNEYSHAYYLTGATVFGSLYLFRIRRAAWLNHLLFLVTCMVLLPPVSYLYTLVHLYLPAMLVAASLLVHGAKRTWAGTLTIVCLVCLMLPLNVYPHVPVLYAGQLQSVLLLGVSLLACFPYRSVHEVDLATSQSAAVAAPA